MKNIIKFLGIISFVVITGLVFTACDEENSASAKINIINNYNKPITEVAIEAEGIVDIYSYEVIKPGNTKTFSVVFKNNKTTEDFCSIWLYAEGVEDINDPSSDFVYSNFYLNVDKTITVTLTSEGKISIR